MNPSIRRILIIANDADGRADIRRMLLCGSDQRYEFSEAALGAEGLTKIQAAASESFDCVLLEYQLPDMDAQEVLTALCGEDDLPPCPVVVITGSDRKAGPRLIMGGAQDFLGKAWLNEGSLTHAVENAIYRFAMLIDNKRREHAVRKSTATFRSLLESAPDAMVIVDQQGEIALVNIQAEQLFGYGRDEMLGQPVEMLMPSRFRLAHTGHRADFSTSPRSRVMGVEQNLLGRRKDGTEFPIEVSLGPLETENGLLVSSAIRDITDRKAFESKLQASEARLGLGVDVAGLSLAEVDYSTGLNHLSADAARLFGLGEVAVAVPRAAVHAMFHPDDREELAVRIAQSLSPNGEGWFAMDHRVVWPSGEVHWLRVRKQVFFNGEGTSRKPRQAMLVAFDVTIEKNALDKVRVAGEFVRGVLNSLPECVVVLDENGVVTAVNEPWERYAIQNGGKHRNTSVGVNYLNVCRQAAAEGDLVAVQTIAGLDSVLAGRCEKFVLEYACNLHDQASWYVMHAQRVSQGPPGVILSHVDITERRKEQRNLEVSEIRFRRLFEAAHDGILILDAATRKITQVNPFLTHLLGYSVERFLGRELWEIGFLRDKQASVSAMQQLDAQGFIRYESLPLEDRQGRQHPVEMVANKYDEGDHSVIQCNIRDISERRRLEQQLQSQASELSDLHRRKDEFLAMLSHELRSPLAPIANAVQLLALEHDSENTAQQHAREIIERQTGKLRHLVDDLLDVSRITTGNVQFRPEHITIASIVAAAIETSRPVIDERRHEFTVSLPSQTIWLQADASRLEQVIVNLLTNAAKYTNEIGHVWLTVNQEGDQCVIRVRDTGVGIPSELLPRIFDLFTQAARSLDRSQGGLGIGLALVKRLTELHGGTVEVSSVVGQGSEFVIRLPVLSTVEPRDSSESKQPEVVLKRLRILVVDDNVDTTFSFSILLRALGHDVCTANDGVKAVQTTVDFHPDVILLDIGLPGMSGYEVAKRIRQHPSHKDIVLIALTGYGRDSDRQSSLQAGFNHHLVKPARIEQVKQILASVTPQPV